MRECEEANRTREAGNLDEVQVAAEPCCTLNYHLSTLNFLSTKASLPAVAGESFRSWLYKGFDGFMYNTTDSEKRKANNNESNHAWNTRNSGRGNGQPLSPMKRPRRTDNP